MKKSQIRDIARRLKITRITLQLSEAQAAAGFGLTLRTYQKWERGGRIFLTQPVLAFCDKYKVNLDWLLCGQASHLDSSLTTCAPGKVAILPVVTVKQLRAKAKAAAFWQNRVLA